MGSSVTTQSHPPPQGVTLHPKRPRIDAPGHGRNLQGSFAHTPPRPGRWKITHKGKPDCHRLCMKPQRLLHRRREAKRPPSPSPTFLPPGHPCTRRLAHYDELGSLLHAFFCAENSQNRCQASSRRLSELSSGLEILHFLVEGQNGPSSTRKRPLGSTMWDLCDVTM